MDSNKIDIYLGSMRENFDPLVLPSIKADLEKISDDQLMFFQTINYKSPTVSIILSLFFGFIGVDRFYIGNILLGILKLLTLGGFGIWTVIDWFLIMSATRKVNYKKFTEQVLITK